MTLFDSIAAAAVAALERPRDLPAQVVKHLGGTYNVTRDAIGPFLLNELPGLEDYQIDLILSPVFTPALHDQAEFAALLGQQSIPEQEWGRLIQEIVGRPTRAHLVHDGQPYPVLLRDVTVERYVRRLRLNGTVPDPLFKLINHLSPAADRSMLVAIARRAIWESAARRDILARYLTITASGDACPVEDAVELLKLAEIYQPADIPDLVARIPAWQQVLRQEIEEAKQPKVFFNKRVEELHGGGRDQRRQDDSRLAAREQEIAFLERLREIFLRVR